VNCPLFSPLAYFLCNNTKDNAMIVMNQDYLNRCIEQALDNLSFLNEMLFDYWLSELYEDDDETMIVSMWNEQTLANIEKDVMMQELV
jgi:hypothetical protein